MSVLMQIRDAPDDVHRTLEVRAAESGQSLSEFLRNEIGKIATRPSMAEMAHRLEERVRRSTWKALPLTCAS